jgi:hypothetical protein
MRQSSSARRTAAAQLCPAYSGSTALPGVVRQSKAFEKALGPSCTPVEVLHRHRLRTRSVVHRCAQCSLWSTFLRIGTYARRAATQIRASVRWRCELVFRISSLRGSNAIPTPRASPTSCAYLRLRGFGSPLSTRKVGSSNRSRSRRPRVRTAGDDVTRGTLTSVPGRSSGGATGGRCSKARRRNTHSTATVTSATGVAIENRSS